MKVLIVTHTYAPDAAPRAFRWTAIAEHWAREGAGVQVITTARGGGPDREIRNGVVVHRVGEGFIGRMQRRTGAGGMSASRASDTGARAAPSLLKRTARTLYDATWRHLFWPDYACLWQRPALARTKSLCGAETFDAVITVSHPFTGHLVGRSLKRVLPGLRWIADIGDPFSLADTVASNNQLLYRGLNKRTEAAVLRECDAVSVTVAGCATVLADRFAIDPAKFHVIPPLLSLPEGPGGADMPELGGADTIDMVYLGVLYPGLRAPDGLLALFAAMHAKNDRLRLHFFGDVKGCEAAFAPYRDRQGTAIQLHGPIPRSAVPATMAAADILINLGNATTHQLPSKLVEYIAAGRPILNVARFENDTAAVFLKDHPATLSVVVGNTPPPREEIDRVLTFVLRPPPVSEADRSRMTEAFEIPAIAGALARLVRNDDPVRIPKSTAP